MSESKLNRTNHALYTMQVHEPLDVIHSKISTSKSQVSETNQHKRRLKETGLEVAEFPPNSKIAYISVNHLVHNLFIKL